jgi:hypothetical protein
LEIGGDVNLSSINDDDELKTNDDFGIPIHERINVDLEEKPTKKT